MRGSLELALRSAGAKLVKKLIILAVNAETSPDVKDYRSEIPMFVRAFSALVDISINRYSTDTPLLLRSAVEMWRNSLLTCRKTWILLARDAEVYFIDASFGQGEDAA